MHGSDRTAKPLCDLAHRETLRAESERGSAALFHAGEVNLARLRGVLDDERPRNLRFLCQLSN